MLLRFWILVNLLTCLGLKSQQFTKAENSIIEAIYQLDFKRYDSLLSVGNHYDIETYRLLYQIMYNKGYSKRTDSLSIQKIKTNGSLIRQMTLSKYHLHNERRNDSIFYLLNNVYKQAKELKEDPSLLKLALLSFLDYYARETTLNEKAFQDYLGELKIISQTVQDYAWLNFYGNLFDGRSVNSTSEIFLNSGKGCKDFYEKNKTYLSIGQKASLLENIIVYSRLIENKTELLSYMIELENLGDLPYTRLNRFNAYLDVGAQYAKQKDYDSALVFFKKSFDLINESDPILGIISFNKFKSFYYHAPKKEYEKAYELLNDAYNLSRELSYQENSAKISERKVILDTAEKEKQLLVEQQRALKNRNWLIAATLALLFGTGIAILLQNNTTKKRQLAEQEAVLKQQRVENLLKKQELVTIDAMIAGQEKERQKVAGELHDDLGSLMATIKLHFDNAKVSKKDPALQNAQKLLEEAYQKVRSIAHSKNSGVMSDQGLLPAIKKMAKTISGTNALEVHVEDFGLGERMENSLELSIFRMVQELVANTIKHAEATKVNIQFTQHEDQLNIIVEDNGKGFDRSKLDKSISGMGLTNIEKRVEHLEGSFTVDSVLGKGTSILIDIPV